MLDIQKVNHENNQCLKYQKPGDFWIDMHYFYP